VQAPLQKSSKKSASGARPSSRALPSPDRSDAELVARARTGDRWAQEAIFRRYVEPVMGLATRLLGRTGEADDVVQDTFAAALVRLDRLEDPDRLKSWLFGIAVHRAKRRLRSRRMLSFFGLAHDDAALFDLASTAASPEVRTELAMIDAILVKVPVEKRVAWLLRHVEGHKLEEVAELTGISLATVKRHIEAVEAKIRAVLAKDGIDATH
jgi:RNA polymerase sigma-70 factor, ECF subfamily